MHEPPGALGLGVELKGIEPLTSSMPCVGESWLTFADIHQYPTCTAFSSTNVRQHPPRFVFLGSPKGSPHDIFSVPKGLWEWHETSHGGVAAKAPSTSTPTRVAGSAASLSRPAPQSRSQNKDRSPQASQRAPTRRRQRTSTHTRRHHSRRVAPSLGDEGPSQPKPLTVPARRSPMGDSHPDRRPRPTAIADVVPRSRRIGIRPTSLR